MNFAQLKADGATVRVAGDSYFVAEISVGMDHREAYAKLFAASSTMLATLHIAKEALLSAAAKVLDNPDWQSGDYAQLMQAKEHVERAIAKAEG